MICPKCSSKTSVMDSRYRKDLKSHWRRRECDVCHYRFSTYETYSFIDKEVVEIEKPKAFMKGEDQNESNYLR